MISTQQIQFHTRALTARPVSSASRQLDDRALRALNAIRKPSTADEIAEFLNRNLDPNERPFEEREVATWLRNAGDKVARLYWLKTRPRR